MAFMDLAVRTALRGLTDGSGMLGTQVNPQFFAFRWITLLLTQEFPFPDAVRLWDTLLSDPAGRTECLLQLCIAMLMNIRNELLEVCLSRSSHALLG